MTATPQQQAPVEVKGWRLEFMAANHEDGRLKEVLYQTTTGETSQQYRFFLSDKMCRLVYDTGDSEEEFPNLLEALERVTYLESMHWKDMQYHSEDYSDASFMLRFKQCNEAMQRAKSSANRKWFRERAIEHADILVQRGIYERTDKGGYKRTAKPVDEHSRSLKGVK